MLNQMLDKERNEENKLLFNDEEDEKDYMNQNKNSLFFSFLINIFFNRFSFF